MNTAVRTRAIPDHTVLEMILLRDGGGGAQAPMVLIAQTLGPSADSFGRVIAANLERGERRMLPAPRLDLERGAQQAWHQDLWLAMSAADRRAAILATGPTALHLAPVLAGDARTVAVVHPPLDAVRIAAGGLPKRRALERLAQASPGDIPARARRLANPQSRALLAPWHDTSALSVGPRPPVDADRWREALFGDVLPQITATAVERAHELAGELAAALGAKSKPVIQAVQAAAREEAGVAVDPDHEELLLGFNWLDAELYDHCIAADGVHA